MDAVDCIKTRMSIRGFKEDPVPQDLLAKVIETACWSPSYKNSQPWEVMVLSGAKKEGLSKMLVELLENGAEPCPDLTAPESWPDAEQARINQLFAKRKELTGIDLGAPEMIVKAKKVNFRFYGAPHAIYLFQDNTLSQWSLFDLGLFAQSLMLAAHAQGLGTVPQAFATDYARDVKKYLDIPTSKRLILGLSIGYPDMDAPANSFRTERSPVTEIVRFVE
ncbi:MAG: nitroreductase [Deltaproteobacteria bacterium]|nr:nitroreductase [Deltaproteobacteria bacterium]